MKILRTLILTAVVLVSALFAYDLYMRNSGIQNRVQYEFQKHELRKQNYEPVNQVFEAEREYKKEVRQETRQERRQERKKERRAKVRRFLNGE